ncbi:MAG: single-stranded DNA-binding protein [Opitutae bacterium]|jgi:single-strand DNA-binding protein|nr:single-stranded DNA-binding protein [Opitutae bacterium]MDG1301919.1 single-stranded DNA-binding protein [Opitutae bacterium]
MASFNKVILMGNLTRDPELRVTAGGISICKIGLAVNRVYSTKDGERREEVTYVDIDAFGKQAEVISKYMRKGRPLFVEGRLKFDQWESEGQKRSKLGVILDKFEFIGGREDGDGGQSAGYDRSSPPSRAATATEDSAPAAAPAANFSNDNDTLDEDVPF